jgi:decaprenyl-phosphate phosphoribosyltransferase
LQEWESLPKMQAAQPTTGVATTVRFGDRIRAHIAIARLDHTVKNVFALPGVLIPLSMQPELLNWQTGRRVALGFLALCLVACSNYVINELLDAPFDREHPVKRQRPAALGLVSTPAAYVQWLIMGAAGIAIGLAVSAMLATMLAALWVMGCVYNLSPVRSKDRPWLDVLSEAVNNPLRLLIGWYMIPAAPTPTISLLASYWMIGCYFMACKRFSEFREIGPVGAAAYRRSFAFYTEKTLLVSIMFYASAAMLFFGAFVMRYRMELVLSFPFVALVMAIYLHLSFEPASPVQNPEKLHRSPALMAAVIGCAAVMVALLWTDIPALYHLLQPTLRPHLR